LQNTGQWINKSDPATLSREDDVYIVNRAIKLINVVI